MATLPFTAEFTHALVTLLFRSPTLLGRVRPFVAASLFPDPAEALVARMVLEHYDRYQRPPVAAEVLESLRQSQEQDERPSFEYTPARSMVEGAAAEPAADERAMEDRIRSWAVDAAMRVALTRSNIDQHLAERDYDGLVNALQKARAYGEKTLEFTDYTDGIEGRIERYQTGVFKDRPVPTFSPTLTDWWRGGHGRGELTVYLALQGVGKTQTLTNDGVAALNAGDRVWHHSCEVSKASQLMRYDQRFARSRAGDLKVEDGVVLRNMVQKGRLRITHSEAGTVPVAAFAAELDRMRPEERPDEFICDYGQLLRPSERNEARHLEVATIYRELRNLGDRYRMAVVSACQSNRAGHQTLKRGKFAVDMPKVLTFEHIAECFDVGGICDNAASLNVGPAEMDMGGTGDPIRGRMAVIKAREGITGGVVNVVLDHDKSTVREGA